MRGEATSVQTQNLASIHGLTAQCNILHDTIPHRRIIAPTIRGEATSVQTQNFASLQCQTAQRHDTGPCDTAQAKNRAHHPRRGDLRTDAKFCVSTMPNRTDAR